MDELSAIWLNRIGLILGFIAFWFATPELLGEDRLKSLENRIESTLEKRLQPVAEIIGVFSFFLIISLLVWLLIESILERAKTGYSACLSFLNLLFLFASKQLVALFETIAGFVTNFFEEFLRSVLKYLANDRNLRLRYLRTGALLFVLGQVFQFIATF